MYGILLIIHVVLCLLLVLVVLIQSGRSGGISGLFGGGGADALFSTSSQQSGVRNATIVIAGLFFLTSLALTMIASRERITTIFNQNVPALPPLNIPAKSDGTGAADSAQAGSGIQPTLPLKTGPAQSGPAGGGNAKSGSDPAVPAAPQSQK